MSNEFHHGDGESCRITCPGCLDYHDQLEEAKAEVDRLRESPGVVRDKLFKTIAERDEARAEVDRLRAERDELAKKFVDMHSVVGSLEKRLERAQPSAVPECVKRLRMLHQDVREEIESAFEHGTTLAGFDPGSRDAVWRAIEWLATAQPSAVPDMRMRCDIHGCAFDGTGCCPVCQRIVDEVVSEAEAQRPAHSAVIVAAESDVELIERVLIKCGVRGKATILDRAELVAWLRSVKAWDKPMPPVVRALLE